MDMVISAPLSITGLCSLIPWKVLSIILTFTINLLYLIFWLTNHVQLVHWDTCSRGDDRTSIRKKIHPIHVKCQPVINVLSPHMSPFLHSHSVLCGSPWIWFAINSSKINKAITMLKIFASTWALCRFTTGKI